MNKGLVEEISNAVKTALDEKLKDFYVERERHYLDHRFVGWQRATVKWTWRAIIFGGVPLLLAYFFFNGGVR